MKASLKIRQEVERFSLLIALLLVLLTAVLTYRAWAAFERTRREAQITQQVMYGTTALLASLGDAETGQRGFLLTGAIPARRHGNTRQPGCPRAPGSRPARSPRAQAHR